MDIGLAIKKFRKDRNISQEGLSLSCNISRAHMYKIESGKSSPTIRILEKIAKELDVKVYELIKYCEIGE